MNTRILIVDDEQQLRLALHRALAGQGYVVADAADGASAIETTGTFKPDLMLLDLMLPDMSGVDVCRTLRTEHKFPIIVLSVVGDEQTKIAALDEGADDYLTKPFAIGELLARIRVALRHVRASQQSKIRVGDLTIDLDRREVRIGGDEVRLTPTEYSLVAYLAENAGRVLTHPMILRAVWGPAYVDDTGVLRTYINQLRTKLGDDPSSPRFIRTDPGVGYRFLENEP